MTITSIQFTGEDAPPSTSAKSDPEALAARAAAELPADFIWGATTSAYQIEGAVAEDGRGPSIWDTFARVPGKTWGGESGDPACDHYHRYADDVRLIAELGLDAYRFSVAWPRIQPTGEGAVNQAGLDFYDRLIDALLTAGIEPWPTLYHWDLPQALQDRGGWSARDTAYRYADYVALVAKVVGDRVKHWSTLNEPFCAAFEGHMSGRHAPGIQDPMTTARAVHHLLLAHGLGVPVLRSFGAAQVGITLNLIPAEPADDSPAAHDAARLVDGQQNRVFLDALLHGRYPDDVVEDFARAGAVLPVVGDDAQVIAAPIDWLGVNYYAPHIVTLRADPRGGSPFIPGDAVTVVGSTHEVTALDWPVRPRSFGAMLRRLHRDCPGMPLYVHENGAAFHDVVSADGSINDSERCRYIARHVDVVRECVREGVGIQGYFVWSLLDNYEWSEGYRMRFGLVHVDFATQRRTCKSSALWYSRLIRAHHGANEPT